MLRRRRRYRRYDALLARAGVQTIVLEKHGDFLRDFRGDTRVLQLCLSQSESGSEPLLRSFAEAALPALQQRQRTAQEVEFGLSN
jgi:hypothetical protein